LNFQIPRHARNRIRFYGVSEADLERSVTSPGWEFEEFEDGRIVKLGWIKGSIGQWRGRGPYLKVVYTIEADVHVIITVGPREKLPPGATDED
jgi:hypothetical protein